MKKTVRIHISGYIFNIDDDAYNKLEAWLGAISKQYAGEEGGDEIVNDIESRVSELFQERIKPEKGVITVSEVDEIITIMGKPEEFEEIKTESKQEEYHEKKTTKKVKRFYRNQDDKILGGVCGGIASYFDIDPIIVRVIFGLFIVFGGIGTFVYILLWIIIPPAKTTTQKLQMKGERVNISNIEKTIRTEFESVKENISNWRKTRNYENMRYEMGRFSDFFLRILNVFFKVIAIFTGAVFMLLGISVVFSLAATIFYDGIIDIFNGPGESIAVQTLINIFPVPFTSFILRIGLFSALAIPFLMLGYAGIKIAFRIKSHNKLIGMTFFILWIIGIIISGFAGLNIADKYKSGNEYTKNQIIEPTKSDTLILKIAENYDADFNDSEFEIADFKIFGSGKETKLFGEVRLDIVKSKNKNTNVKIEYSSQGSSRRQASIYAKNIIYNWTQTDNLIEFNPFFSVAGEKKIYNQDVQITFELPEGKSVFLGEKMNEIIYDIDNIQNMWDSEMLGKTWIMTNKGLCLSNEYLKKNIAAKDSI